MPDDDRTIEIWTPAPAPEGKAALPMLGRQRLEVGEIRVSDLADNLGSLLADVQTAFEKAQLAASAYAIEEIELSIGVNAKGGLALIGKLEAGMEAGIKVKLKRKPDAA
jgi:hypothetical protein